MSQEIIFDRQGLIVYAVPASYDREHYEPPQVRFKVVRPYGEVHLKLNYVNELIDALARWKEEPE